MLNYRLTRTTGCPGSATTNPTTIPPQDPLRNADHDGIFAHHSAPEAAPDCSTVKSQSTSARPPEMSSDQPVTGTRS